MIGKPEWFAHRKYTGWGLNPRTWQGWVYLGVMVASIYAIQILPVAGDIKTYLMLALAIIFGVDLILIYKNIKKDERDTIHEALADRNALWAMLSVIVFALGFQVAVGAVQHRIVVDYWLTAALVAAVIAKAITNRYLDKND